MIRFLSICTFLFAPFFGNAQHQADSLFRAGDWVGAQLEYERLVFEGKPPTSLWLLKKAYCQKAQLRYDQALVSLKRINLYEAPDSLATKLLYETALLHYLNGQPDLALGVIQEWRYLRPDGFSGAGRIIEILALAENQQWVEARDAFDVWAGSHAPAGWVNPLAGVEKMRWRKRKKAEALSFLLPGSGQMYAGFPGRGLVSTALNTGAILFAVKQFSSGFFFSGAYTGVGLFYLFYTGGARYAVKLAETKNQRQQQELISALHTAFRQQEAAIPK